mmetsp:Transcript_12855/g.35588  ORF Transcript_12855/g.35588 Transcript_12855/m.35588 type:complete len:198 (-) Transcript_12855:107-700(-)
MRPWWTSCMASSCGWCRRSGTFQHHDTKSCEETKEKDKLHEKHKENQLAGKDIQSQLARKDTLEEKKGELKRGVCTLWNIQSHDVGPQSGTSSTRSKQSSCCRQSRCKPSRWRCERSARASASTRSTTSMTSMTGMSSWLQHEQLTQLLRLVGPAPVPTVQAQQPSGSWSMPLSKPYALRDRDVGRDFLRRGQGSWL